VQQGLKWPTYLAEADFNLGRALSAIGGKINRLDAPKIALPPLVDKSTTIVCGQAEARYIQRLYNWHSGALGHTCVHLFYGTIDF